MKKMRGEATLLIMGAIFIGLLAVTVISDHYLGKNNPIEEVSEEMAEDTLEGVLRLPAGTIELDINEA